MAARLPSQSPQDAPRSCRNEVALSLFSETRRKSRGAPLCECADEHCVETLELSLREYEEIRASPVHFPVKVGHDYPEFERVVAVSDGYAVVEKIGAAAEVAKMLDPRSRVKGGSPV